jgi:hypothetical protein
MKHIHCLSFIGLHCPVCNNVVFGHTFTCQVPNESLDTVNFWPYAVVLLKYLGTTVTNKNLIQEEIKWRLNMGNAHYHSVQKFQSSHLLSKSIKIRIYKTINLPAVLYGCETWSLTLKEDHRMRWCGLD